MDKYGEVTFNANLKNYNTYGIDTTADYLIKVSSIDNLVELIKYLKENDMPYYILGGGSNVLLPDNNFSGVIINLDKLNNVSINENKVIAECGIRLSALCKMTLEASLGGLEYLSLIPGTLGGALYGNAGSFDHFIYENISYVEVLRKGKIFKIKKKDIDYDYRYSMFKSNDDIILRACFELKYDDKETLNKIFEEVRLKKVSSQPLEYRSAGSVFKNGDVYSAGKLIDDLGLKGVKIGDAEVSEKHANFIINKGNATGNDIRNLIDYIKEKVYNEYAINLELEQIIVDWE